MFSILKRPRVLNLAIDLQLNFLDSMVTPILLYECVAWGNENIDMFVTLYIRYCKYVLQTSTNLNPKPVWYWDNRAEVRSF